MKIDKSEEYINNIRMEYLGKKEVDKRNIPAIRKIVRGPSSEEIEKAVTQAIGRGHALYTPFLTYYSFFRYI